MARRRTYRLFRRRNFNEFGIGAFLGLEWSRASRQRAEDRAIKVLQDLDFLPKSTDIEFCGKPLLDAVGNPAVDQNGDPILCTDIMRSNADDSKVLGFVWRCGGTQSPHGRHKAYRRSPLDQTLFAGRVKLKFRMFFKLLYCYIDNVTVTKAIRIMSCSNSTGVQWYTFFREALGTIGWHDYEKIGGDGDVVEMDEAHIYTRKYNVGRLLAGQRWVFGGISRTTGQRFAMRVVARNAVILNAEIVDNVAPGTTICTDGWAAYNDIANLSGVTQPGQGVALYRAHHVVIHQRNFVWPPKGTDPMWIPGINEECRDRQFVGPCPHPPDPVHGELFPFRIHTQKVERSWRELKKNVKSTRSDETIDAYIGAYLYFENIMKKTRGGLGAKFKRVLADLKRVYPGANQKPVMANRPNFRNFAGQAVVDLCSCDRCTQ